MSCEECERSNGPHYRGPCTHGTEAAAVTTTHGILLELIEAIEGAHDTHIYAEDDEHPDDCAYCAVVKAAKVEADRLRPRQPAVLVVCETCSSEDIAAEATVLWDKDAQCWEVADVMDKGHWCRECNGETRLKFQVIA
jgi:hypothetical protein